MKLFDDALKNSRIPSDEQALIKEFQKLAKGEGLTFENPSALSPWKRLLQAIAVEPATHILRFISRSLMPSLFVKTAEGEFLDLLGFGFGVERKSAQKLKGLIEVTRDHQDVNPLLPAGSWIQTAPLNGRQHRVKTLQDAVFKDTELTTKVSVEAEYTGAEYNLGQDYFVILQNPVPGIQTVTNGEDWILSPGSAQESDESYRERIRNQFLASSSYHSHAVYRRLISEQTGFDINRIFFQEATEERGPGAVDALILFDAEVPSQQYIDQVNYFIRDQGHHGHGDDLLVKPLPETHHDVTLTLYLASGLTLEQSYACKNQAQKMVESAFRKNLDYHVTLTWPYSRFSFARLAAEILREIPLIESMSFDNADIVSELSIPRLKTLRLEVEGET